MIQKDFYLHLNTLIQQTNLSKNKLIKQTDIDRSTFFQILSGKRMPTAVQFGSILSAAIPALSSDREKVSPPPDTSGGYFTKKTLDTLLQEYLELRMDPVSDKEWHLVQKFIQIFSRIHSQTPDIARASNLISEKADSKYDQNFQIIQNFIKRQHIVHGQLDIYMSTVLIEALSLNKSLYALSDSSVQIRQILGMDFRDASGEDMQSILYYLAELLHLLEQNSSTISVYQSEKSSLKKEDQLFPYYILGQEEMLLIDSRGENCLEIDDMQIVSSYRKSFEDRIHHLPLLFRSMGNYLNLAQVLNNRYQNIGDCSVLFAAERPCAMQLVTPGLIDKYIHDTEFATFAKIYTGNLQRIKNFCGLMSPKGLAAFEADQCILEAGMNFHLTGDDMMGINTTMQNLSGTRMIIVPFSDYFIPDWELAIYDQDEAILSLFNNTDCIIHLTNKDIVHALYIYYDCMRKIFQRD